MATLAGVALIGFVAAALDSAPQPNTTNAAVETQRDQAADRANRSVRESETPAAAESPQSAAPPTQAPEPAKTEAPPTPAPEVKKADWVLPMDAPTSSCFGPRWGTQHQGIDFAGDENTPIHAVGAGEIIAAGWVYTGYGISVVVDHGNGFQTHYAHLNKVNVDVGDHVDPADVVGWEGSTGDSTGPHLHFEVHNGMWNQVDPAPWMRDYGVTIDGC
jgi:murein DD-endopeptidase MepM/ murein hydrolase activator NlpD